MFIDYVLCFSPFIKWHAITVHSLTMINWRINYVLLSGESIQNKRQWPCIYFNTLITMKGGWGCEESNPY